MHTFAIHAHVVITIDPGTHRSESVPAFSVDAASPADAAKIAKMILRLRGDETAHVAMNMDYGVALWACPITASETPDPIRI